MDFGKKQPLPPKNRPIKSNSYFALLFLLIFLRQAGFSSKIKYPKCNNPLQTIIRIHSVNFLMLLAKPKLIDNLSIFFKMLVQQDNKAILKGSVNIAFNYPTPNFLFATYILI